MTFYKVHDIQHSHNITQCGVLPKCGESRSDRWTLDIQALSLVRVFLRQYNMAQPQQMGISGESSSKSVSTFATHTERSNKVLLEHVQLNSLVWQTCVIASDVTDPGDLCLQVADCTVTVVRKMMETGLCPRAVHANRAQWEPCDDTA